MSLLELARGPALQWSLIIFLLGVTWRLAALLLLAPRKDYSAPRKTDTWWGGLRTVFTRVWPRPELLGATALPLLMGYTFHVGLAITVLAFVPHIEFIRSLLGVSWPGLPSNVVVLAGAVTLVALTVLLVRRINSPVLRLISNWDDYLAWILTAAPVATGLMAFAHLGLRYETMLALHILSFDLLLLWFPFGKLMHAFLLVPSRAREGAAFEHKGVRA